MVGLAGGQQAAEFMTLTPLGADQILAGHQGADLTTLAANDRHRIVTRTPLWFYVLREAELNDGVLTGVGGRIVAEVLHRAMEGSRYSIVRRPAWQPDLCSPSGRFTMAHLVLHAYDHDPRLLNPVG
ncbi:hypothetical protein HCN51_34785 [Nonomuraea sp. FMUSA5-5]|uniref:Uncharacterized protein n=1 Tax=Nonomuraea composti TaxID=2720023 RepID=A0ABX1BDG8_9ACTN|nr:hypothetical protein [Nonomuraea sp. FMUSA5-5]NJP94552.1 hypothetical protein [Nonomuraea sp. FMUSA5-5]